MRRVSHHSTDLAPKTNFWRQPPTVYDDNCYCRSLEFPPRCQKSPSMQEGSQQHPESCLIHGQSKEHKAGRMVPTLLISRVWGRARGRDVLSVLTYMNSFNPCCNQEGDAITLIFFDVQTEADSVTQLKTIIICKCFPPYYLTSSPQEPHFRMSCLWLSFPILHKSYVVSWTQTPEHSYPPGQILKQQ